ncbi:MULTISPECIES: cell division protein ZapA [unclassified Acinetobacter]|uniref:cell division protein ZapA n=1 Tax=unclassified Acinetobacter TaxID=196816 RepID=UPI000A337B77|nr:MULTISPECIES: cell division protein ZapA [unclassified Acinetobacter]OTG61114.1 cell division protein ZapA [Acinetobacter sp. ANC 4204]RGD93597.1 cell division protein ZapA [Acinetobacter sp. SWAC57]
MSEQITVELRVLGHSFRLVTTEKEKADLERAALLLNDKYDEFRRKAPRVEPSKIIIMVALELMQEVLSMNKTLQEYAHAERLLASIIEDVKDFT